MDLEHIKRLLDLEYIKGLMDGFELSSLLPDVGTLLGKLELGMRLVVVLGPVVMVIMGLLYLFAAPSEANHYFGFRCYYGMGSEKAWRFTQRLAGIVWLCMGVLLAITMLILSSGFAQQNAIDMVTSAIIYVLWEGGLLLAANLVIRIIVTVRYNRHGERRRKK